MELTREQVLSMEPGRELDRIVAIMVFDPKVITKTSKISETTLYLLVSGEEINPMEKGKTLRTAWWRLSEKLAWEACPKYSSDISASFEIVEELQNSQLYVDIRTCADFYEVLIGDETPTVAYPKLPEAIAKAALIAIIESTETTQAKPEAEGCSNP